MAWTTPQTWTAALVTVADFNEQIRDNLDWLKSRPNDQYVGDGTGSYTVTATSPTKVSTDFDLTITTTASCKVLVTFTASVVNAANTNNYALDVYLDGSSVTPSNMDAIFVGSHASERQYVAWTALIDVTSAGSHTFSLYGYVVSSGTLTLYNDDSSAIQYTPVFSVMEVA